MNLASVIQSWIDVGTVPRNATKIFWGDCNCPTSARNFLSFDSMMVRSLVGVGNVDWLHREQSQERRRSGGHNIAALIDISKSALARSNVIGWSWCWYGAADDPIVNEVMNTATKAATSVAIGADITITISVIFFFFFFFFFFLVFFFWFFVRE